MALIGFEYLVSYVLLLVVVLNSTLRLSRAQVLQRHFGDLAVRAQEEERQRIGRELHDQVSQDLAAIAICQSKIIQSIHPDRVELLSEVVKQKKNIEELAEAIHSLSRDLHPYKLKLLGTEKALTSYCADFEQRHALPVEPVIDLGSAAVSAEGVLCLCRVLQESLANVQKHAKAAEVKVSLSRVGRTCELRAFIEANRLAGHAHAPGSRRASRPGDLVVKQSRDCPQVISQSYKLFSPII
jgi:signal transduction histidine kinase